VFLIDTWNKGKLQNLNLQVKNRNIKMTWRKKRKKEKWSYKNFCFPSL